MLSASPLLFIHGAHSDSRVWHQGFLHSFERRGLACQALDLPGHGARCRERPVEQLRLADYASDLRHAAAALGQPPVLVGHSMGGYLAQDFVLSGGRAAALVLLASAPPQGMARDLLAFALRHPWLAMRMEYPGRETGLQRRQRIRASLMGPATPDATVDWVEGFLQRESPHALRELGMHALPARPLEIPVFIAAGAKDKLFALGTQRGIARAYGVPLHVEAAMGHMLPLEPGWPQLADAIAGFLDQGLPRNR
ncbi:MAG: alpha/beta fold hydrolase [Pseudomonadota bacterium]|nr:alpha/beta fold hydrolase [Pseudomonadota bacterium]